MSRDFVLCTLSVCLCGLLTLAVAHVPLGGGSFRAGRSASAAEVRAWHRLWLPLLPALLVLGVLVGWAVQEPATTDEMLRPLAFALAIPPALLVLRASVRGIGALRSVGAPLAAATVGLVRPRVLVSAALRERLDPSALNAALAHEHAHVRHRDPLRIWLAQLVTDLQWPSRGAVDRLRDWQRALELARDEEARRQGAKGEDLAAAIILATRLGPPDPRTATATLTGPAIELTMRVHRLLDPLPPPSRDGRLLVGLVVVVGVLAACGAGLHFGDALVRALPIVAV
jgi:hypothetical protein